MRLPFGWVWPTLAALATVVAVMGRDSPSVAVPAAAFAVIAAGLALAVSVARPSSRGPEEAGLDPISPGRVREAFYALARGREEPLGREMLVTLLDQIERVSVRPDLPLRATEELRTIVSAPEEGFRRYLTERVEAIEGTS